MVGVRIRRGGEKVDEALVRQMFDLHGKAMLAYATRLTGDRAAAEEVFQEVLLCAGRNPDGFGNGRHRDRIRLLSMVGRVVAARQRRRTSSANRPEGVPGPRRPRQVPLGTDPLAVENPVPDRFAVTP